MVDKQEKPADQARSARQARLKTALRDNLRRRKAASAPRPPTPPKAD